MSLVNTSLSQDLDNITNQDKTSHLHYNQLMFFLTFSFFCCAYDRIIVISRMHLFKIANQFLLSITLNGSKLVIILWCPQVPQCILLLGVQTQTTSYTQVESNWLLNLYKLLQSQSRYHDQAETHTSLYTCYCCDCKKEDLQHLNSKLLLTPTKNLV